jgi:hypothetical protein
LVHPVVGDGARATMQSLNSKSPLLAWDCPVGSIAIVRRATKSPSFGRANMAE